MPNNPDCSLSRMSVEIYTDGSSFGNPGPSGAGAAFYTKNENNESVLIYNHSRALGDSTNNVAEYTAIADALAIAFDMGYRNVTVLTDSLLAVRQLNGEWRCKHFKIQELKGKVEELVCNFESVEFIHVRRNLNSVADELARKGSEESVRLSEVE